MQCIYPKASKPILDEIDFVLAHHYSFTEEELDFIVNYNIKCHMGRDAEGGEGMNFRFSKHAEQELAHRGISRDIVEGVLSAPAQKVPEHGAIVCYQVSWRSTGNLTLCASW